MTTGINTTLQELITLNRYAHAGLFQHHKQSQTAGQYISPKRGRGMEFAEVRNYQAGDEIRHMEWRMTARTGRPHVKLYHEERERPVVLLVDFNPSMYFGTRCSFKSVLAARLAALFAWQALYQGDKISGLFFSATHHDEFPPSAREVGLMRLLNSLVTYSHEIPKTPHTLKPRPLSDALLRLRHVNKPGSLILIISDFYTLAPDCEQHLAQLRQHNELRCFHLYDQIERHCPKPGLYPISNGLDATLLDTYDPEIRTLYEAQWVQICQQIQTQCRRQAIPYLNISTQQDLKNLFLHGGSSHES